MAKLRHRGGLAGARAAGDDRKGRAAAVAAASFWPLQQSASGTSVSSTLRSLAAWALASSASIAGQSTSLGNTRSRYFSIKWRAESRGEAGLEQGRERRP